MVKDKHIISGLNGFFHKNDCNKAVNNLEVKGFKKRR